MKLQTATLILAIGIAIPAAAQQEEPGVATSFEQLRLLVAPVSSVTVTDLSGSVTSGRVESLSSTALSLLVDGVRRSYGEMEVNTIRQRRDDPLADGARRGFWIGAGLFAIAIVSCGDCRPGTATGYLAAAGAAAVYGGIGAGIGVGFDAMVRTRQTVYRRPGALVSLRF